MIIARRPSAIKVDVIPASQDQEPVLANLLELYVDDFSEFLDVKVGADGRFGYKNLSLYWKDPNRHPFIVMADDHLAGFVFVARGSAISGSADVWDMAEFFITRSFRRSGVGTRAAHHIWRTLPGKWEVRVIGLNKSAKEFWARSIGDFLSQEINPVSVEKEGKPWFVFSFET